MSFERSIRVKVGSGSGKSNGSREVECAWLDARVQKYGSKSPRRRGSAESESDMNCSTLKEYQFIHKDKTDQFQLNERTAAS